MIGGSSLPGVGRALPGFILAANYTELSRNAPIRRCERQQRDFLAALDDGQEISTSFDLNLSKERHNFAIRRWTTFTTNDFTYHSPGHRRDSPECRRRRTGPRNGPIPRFSPDVLHEATRCPAARRFTVIVPTCGAMGAVTKPTPVALEMDTTDRKCGAQLAMPVGVISQDWATQLGFDAAAPWRTGALDVTRQATDSGNFVNARCYTSETERRSVLDSGSTTTTNTARTLLGNDAERLPTLHRLDAFTAVTVPERSRL